MVKSIVEDDPVACEKFKKMADSFIDDRYGAKPNW